MSNTIRSFIAFDLPPAIVSMLQDVQNNLKQLKIVARWVRPENIHLTLKFLGDIRSGDVERIGVAMTNAVENCSPIQLATRGIGVFPGTKRPRVVWVGIGGGVQPLFDLQSRLEEELAALGFPREKRGFKAHLTLGRFKHTVNPSLIRQMIKEFSDLKSESFLFEQLVLYKSDLKPTGAVYSHLKHASFGITNVE